MKTGKVNNLNSKDPNIFRIFKLDLSHFSLLLTEPKTNPKGWILKKSMTFFKQLLLNVCVLITKHIMEIVKLRHMNPLGVGQ